MKNVIDGIGLIAVGGVLLFIFPIIGIICIIVGFCMIGR